MKGLLFLTLLIVLGIIAYSYTSREGFKDASVSKVESQAGIVNVPTNVPEAKSIDVSSPAAYLPPADTEYGPAFGEIARVNTLPYRDPALETASLKRLAELRQDLAGFLAFEAKGLQDLSDPAIQLPLGTLRGDYQRVGDEVDVLKRNPGLNSQLTMRDVNDVQANLNYLRKKYRLSVNSISWDGSKEGFEDGAGEGARATQEEVEAAILRVKAEIQRLSGSGTTDPVVVGRTGVLTRISQKMEEIVRDVKSGARTPDQIPIFKKDLDSFLPVAGDPNKPIPKFLDENNLPPTLANLFPAYGAGDISGAKITQFLFNQYADTIFKGLSWTIGLKYTSPNEVQVAGNGTGMTSGLESRINNTYTTIEPESRLGTSEQVVGPSKGFSSPVSFSRGEFEDCTNPSRDNRGGGLLPNQEASHFDWKVKAAAICEAVRSQGLDPREFGCLGPEANVGPDYSWRGNARMVCTRLESSTNTALPELCGCPPKEWAGWRA